LWAHFAVLCKSWKTELSINERTVPGRGGDFYRRTMPMREREVYLSLCVVSLSGIGAVCLPSLRGAETQRRLLQARIVYGNFCRYCSSLQLLAICAESGEPHVLSRGPLYVAVRVDSTDGFCFILHVCSLVRFFEIISILF
jgi:hypothetical protein